MPSCHLPHPQRLGLCLAVVVVLSLLSVATPALADLEAAERAFYAKDYEAALREAQPLAEQGDEVAQRIVSFAKAMIELKRLHDEYRAATGPIDLRDYDGRKMRRSAQDQARFDSGQRHYDEGAYEAAFREWLPLAEAGDAEVQFMLSVLYRLGQGVAEDPEKADSYLLRAAEGGYGPAQVRMPQLFAVGLSTGEAAQREGFYWAMRAAVNGQVGAYFVLSTAYCYGSGTDKNPVLADTWGYMALPDKNHFLDRRCVQDVEWPTSYYEAIAERAKAMLQAYDIPLGSMGEPAEAEDGDPVDDSQ